MPWRQVLVFFAATPLLYANIIIDSSLKTIEVGKYLKILRTHDTSLSPSQVLNMKGWQRHEVEVPNFGYDSNIFWAQLNINVTEKMRENLLLEYAYAPGDLIEVFFIHKQKQLMNDFSGDSI